MFGPDPVAFGDALRANAISVRKAPKQFMRDDLQNDARFEGIEVRNTNQAPELRTPFGAGGAIASYLAAPIVARSGLWLGALFLAHPHAGQFGKTPNN